VRELQNVLRGLMLGTPRKARAASLSRDTAAEASLPPALRENHASLRQASDWYITRVLAHCGGNHSEAARILGIDRATIRRRVAHR
jgi:DNA-binding NtrC family response regulator